jgi:hypothetical protein
VRGREGVGSIGRRRASVEARAVATGGSTDSLRRTGRRRTGCAPVREVGWRPFIGGARAP